MTSMIPPNLDYVAMFDDLNTWGIGDYKIEAICGLAEGHVAHIRAGRRVEMAYPRAARIYNFWMEERQLHPDDCQGVLLTT